MRPAARIAALAELIEQLEGSLQSKGLPADVIVTQYFRQRRYAGSRDRREISGSFYAYLRSRECVLWSAQHITSSITPRALLLCYLGLYSKDSLQAFEEEAAYGPEPLTPDERQFVEQVQALNVELAPWHAKANIPEWLASSVEARFKNEAEIEASALNEPANFDIRLNEIKASQNTINHIKEIIQNIEKNKYSNIGYSVSAPVNLDQIPAYKHGEVEVQDQAAQIACLLADVRKGMIVADVCAGAGGKSLTLSSLMKNSGQVFALDMSEKRLRACKKRIDRGGHRNIQVRKVSEAGDKRKEVFSQLHNRCDRVVVDVPCSGSGTWRRSPDQRWRIDAESFSVLNELQYGLLVEAAECVKPKGRLLYMTCSVLPEENEAVVERFLKASKGWALVPYLEVWDDVSTAEPPHSLSSIPEALQLSPRQHGTDGFFVAIFERSND